MTELWKSGIDLMFPIYLLAIVIGLIIISRYSVRLSNRIADSSVQVLVTVVHLSVATLLSSILDVFTPAFIYTNTSDVPLSVNDCYRSGSGLYPNNIFNRTTSWKTTYEDQKSKKLPSSHL